MERNPPVFDVVVVGGGFYGVAIAAYFGMKSRNEILLFEKESGFLRRASYNNQARIHSGYHYPRSFTTAYRSRINVPRFLADWPEAVKADFTALYAVGRRNSKVTARQFERFCRDIGAYFAPAADDHCKLFDSRLVEAVFQVEERVFDTRILAEWAERQLCDNGVEARFQTTVTEIRRAPNSLLSVTAKNERGQSETVLARYVFNCTYSGLNQIGGDFRGTRSGLKHEITEMALLRLPPELAGLGVTMMDGPFFSLMPFPARSMHTLSHVRYTPHCFWRDRPGLDPSTKLMEYERDTRASRMIRNTARYLPAIVDADHADSMFETKTVLVKNEGDDGRPILYEHHAELPGCYSILGGKIDNIYDVIERLDAETWD